jgi:hypothetical protein
MFDKRAIQTYFRVLTQTIQPFYEDFPLTIERLRLTLLNSELLTTSEMSKFMRVTEQGYQLCIRIFVRHAVRHGTYRLFSLGRDPNPEFPRPQPPALPTGQAPASAGPQGSAPAATKNPTPSSTPASAAAPSRAQLAERNATLERQLAALNVRVDRAEGRRGTGRGRAASDQRGRSAQPRGSYNGRSDRGNHGNQGARMPPAMQPAPATYTTNPSSGYYQPYPGPSYAHGAYMSAPPMGGYGMQQYQQHFPSLAPQQYGGGWTGNRMTYSAHQANSSQSGTSSGFAMPPPPPQSSQSPFDQQQARSVNFQGQTGQHVPGSSGNRQGRMAGQNQGPSAAREEQASVSGTNSHVPRPDAKEFNPGAATHCNDLTILLTSARI